MRTTRDKGRKIVWKSGPYGLVAYCPACGTMLGHDYERHPNFCRECGQKLEGGEIRRNAGTAHE